MPTWMSLRFGNIGTLVSNFQASMEFLSTIEPRRPLRISLCGGNVFLQLFWMSSLTSTAASSGEGACNNPFQGRKGIEVLALQSPSIAYQMG
jgi:hypothetical protein